MRKLTSKEIEVKVKQVFEKGAVLLLYKTARVDMAILDETFGSYCWQCDYKVVKDNLYCGIGVVFSGNWIWKWDCGIESREDGDGNEKKGEASDAFKRAGFKWGIGVELYTSPFIFANVETVSNNGKWYLKDKFIKFSVQGIWYDEDGDIAALVIEDNKGNIVFQWKKKGFVIPKDATNKHNKVDDALIKKFNTVKDYLQKNPLTKEVEERVLSVATELNVAGFTKEHDELLSLIGSDDIQF